MSIGNTSKDAKRQKYRIARVRLLAKATLPLESQYYLRYTFAILPFIAVFVAIKRHLKSKFFHLKSQWFDLKWKN